MKHLIDFINKNLNLFLLIDWLKMYRTSIQDLKFTRCNKYFNVQRVNSKNQKKTENIF